MKLSQLLDYQLHRRRISCRPILLWSYDIMSFHIMLSHQERFINFHFRLFHIVRLNLIHHSMWTPTCCSDYSWSCFIPCKFLHQQILLQFVAASNLFPVLYFMYFPIIQWPFFWCPLSKKICCKFLPINFFVKKTMMMIDNNLERIMYMNYQMSD